MKRRLAIWLLKQFPVKERRDLMISGISDLSDYQQKEVVSYFLYKLMPNCHIHHNPVKKVAA